MICRIDALSHKGTTPKGNGLVRLYLVRLYLAHLFSARRFRAFLLGAGLLGLVSLPATAGQHCVTCDAPAATYLCEAQNGPGILAANGGQLACITELAKRGGHDRCSVIRRAAAQCDGLAPTVLFPGTGDADVTATDGAVTPPPVNEDTGLPATQPAAPQNTPVENLDGAAPPPPETFTADDGVNPARTADPRANPKKTEKARKDPPKTVAEMAGRAYEDSKKGLGKAGKTVGETAKKTGEQIGKAGNAVGNAASKTWNCVTSLFSDC